MSAMSLSMRKNQHPWKPLHEIYELGIGNSSYSHKLKIRFQKDFGETICFLSQKDKTLLEIIISAEYFTADIVFHSNERTSKHAAKVLSKDIFEKVWLVSNGKLAS